MKQSRSTSFLKSVISTGAGFGISLFAQWAILPLLGVTISLHQNISFAIIMTVISIARGYLLERVFEFFGMRMKLSPFAYAGLAERVRQKDVEGWDESHDDAHAQGELARAAAAYALGERVIYCERWQDSKTVEVTGRLIWGWDHDWWKPADYRRNLVKAVALLIAEGERFDRNRKSARRVA
jgi:hypothetical protein